MGILRDGVVSFRLTHEFVQSTDEGYSALQQLQDVRQRVLTQLAAIQASSAFTAQQKADAIAEAQALRQAILDFADIL